MLGRLAPQVVGALGEVVDDQGVHSGARGPAEPLTGRHAQMDVDHAIHQGGGHGLDDRRVLGAIARADDNGSLR